MPGKHYQPNYGPRADRFIDLYWLDPRRGWALVHKVCVKSQIRCATVYGTQNGGETWSRLSRPDPFGPLMLGQARLRFLTPRIGYLYAGALSMTTDGGRNWTQLRGPQVESVVFSGDRVFRLVHHGTGCPGPCRIALERSMPGTDAWTTLRRWPHAPGFGEELVAGGANLYVIFWGHIAGGEPSAHALIEVSRDRGRTWSARTDPCGGSGGHEKDADGVAAARDLLSILCVPRIAQKPSFTALSRDAGRTFTAGAPIPLSAPEQIAVGDDGAVAVGNGGIRSGGGEFDYQLSLSGNGGRTWRVAIRDQEPRAEGMEGGSLQFVGTRTVSWVGYPYFAWQSSDAGLSWRKAPAP